MIDLRPLFENFFDDPNHSLKELASYSNKHLMFLSAHNPANVLDDVIAEVSAANTAFAACLGDEEALAAAREAANQARNNLKKSMTGPNGPVSRAAAAVKAAYGSPSPDYTSCFPFGVKGITEATILQMEERLENLRAALAARSAQVGATHVTAITTLKTNWVTLKNAAETAATGESTGEEARTVCRENLTKALTRSALWLAWNFCGQPAKHDLYCPVHLLRNPLHPGGPGAVTLSAGTWDSTSHLVTLTMESDDPSVTVYTLQRRMVGEADFSNVLDDIGADAEGNATFDDEVPTGHYEYRVIARNGDGVEGEPSNVVTVHAV